MYPYLNTKLNFCGNARDSGRKVEDPDMLERIRLTIINNLLKYHPVSMATILKLCPWPLTFWGCKFGFFSFFQILLLFTKLVYLIPCFCFLSFLTLLSRNLVSNLQWVRHLESKLQRRRWVLMFIFAFHIFFFWFIPWISFHNLVIGLWRFTFPEHSHKK